MIAADGGYTALQRLGIRPDLLLGDFDSLTDVPTDVPIVKLPAEKDDTDVLAALRIGCERGYRQFQIFGGTGGRFDHTIANLQSLLWLAQRGARGTLVASSQCATVISGSLTFGPEASGYLSVFAVGGPTTVTLSGLKYEIADTVLEPGFPRGVSNEFRGVPSQIDITRGFALVVYPVEVQPL
jgi:thiamine pyrophosphokinase